jgi:hypothetical protein
LKKKAHFFRDNALSIFFFLLFLGSFFALWVSGFLEYNHKLTEKGISKVSFWSYFFTGNFLDAVFVNCQAAILQLGALIFFSIFMLQKGAVHSRRKPKPKEVLRHRSMRTWWYANSLSCVFLLLFLLLFILHLLYGTIANNENRVLNGEKEMPMVKYLLSATCWYQVFQTWQAEFFAIFVYIVLSIFLKQEFSPESKPLYVDTKETGEHNA